ncbi:Retinoblastoma-related protein 1 [Triticum urartu]|uniref:Retinoblastoma-related protein 1 n=1 Tax=Triticum urartu TaxID=4572 RepID=M7ZKD9_TRIUA|nr:Retinoblastoma-related protein 1 [Triticum urartu]
MEAIFLARQLMERYREQKKDLHMVFIDLEKAYDKIPQNGMWWALEKHKVPTKYITLIKDMYDNVLTSVRTSDVDTDDFLIKDRTASGVTRDIHEDIPWCMLFVDDVVLVDDSRTGVNRKLELWRQTLESKGFRLSRTKTEYMMCGFSTTRCEEEEDGGIDEDVNHRIKAGWMKWRQAFGILCDKRVPQKLKGKFYRMTVRPAMLYGAECWLTKRRHVQQLGVAEMRVLRWMCGHTRKDRVRNDDIRDRVGVAPIAEKLCPHRLRWFGHIQRRPLEAPGHSGRLKHAENVKRGRGRPNLTWEEAVNRDLKDWSITKELAMDRVKQTVRGVDLLASLCHNYHTSEDRLREMMGKFHKAIEEFFSMKAVRASECKTETLDKIDTGMAHGLIYFRDLLDKECFHSNFEKLEKLSSTTSWEGELDLKRFLINNDNIISAGNSSRDFTNLSCPKRVFETLASPTKTIKNMLTVPSSPSSPANGGSVKVVQMTPVTSAMTTAKWLREVISLLPEKPSSKLEKFLSSCDTDLTSDVTKRVSIILEAIFPTKPSGHWSGSMGLNCTNAFDIPWAQARKMEASKLYYRVLEAICRAESLNTNVNNLTPLLSNERFHRCLIACSAELVLATHKTVIMMFPAVLESTGLTAFDLSKIIENFVRHEESLPRELKRHLNSLEEQLLESMAWEKGSSLYNSLVVARPSLASEINRLGLLAESMPSLDDIVARQNFHAEDLPATPSKKRAAYSGTLLLGLDFI